MIEKREPIETPKETNHSVLLCNQINADTEIFKPLIKTFQWDEKLPAPFSLNSFNGYQCCVYFNKSFI